MLSLKTKRKKKERGEKKISKGVVDLKLIVGSWKQIMTGSRYLTKLVQDPTALRSKHSLYYPICYDFHYELYNCSTVWLWQTELHLYKNTNCFYFSDEGTARYMAYISINVLLEKLLNVVRVLF